MERGPKMTVCIPIRPHSTVTLTLLPIPASIKNLLRKLLYSLSKLLYMVNIYII